MTAIIIASAVIYIVWSSKFTQGKYAGYLAWILHGVVCYSSLFDENGWKLHLSNAILLVSWLSVAIVMFYKLNNLWVKIPVLVFIIIAFTLNNPYLVVDHLEFTWQLDLHITLSLMAYSILSVASLYALSLYINIIKIKNTDIATGNNLIALIDEEKKLFHLIFIGWLLLTTALLSGVVFVDNFLQQHLGHKVVFSFLAWLTFGMIILSRILKGLRGEKLILLTIVGMTLLATGYLGSKIVLELIL